MNNSTAQGQNSAIFVTGGAGFIGTNFVRRALEQQPKWRIMNLDALTYAGNPANFSDLLGHMADRHEFFHGDTRDHEQVMKLCENAGVKGIVHFAAESHVDRSILGPGAFVDTNVVGTFRLLEAARAYWEVRQTC